MVRLFAILVVLVAVGLGLVVFTAPGTRAPLAVDAEAVQKAAEAQAAGAAAGRGLAAAAERAAQEAAESGDQDDVEFLPAIATGDPVSPWPQGLPPLDPGEAERLRQETADRVAAEAGRQAAAEAVEVPPDTIEAVIPVPDEPPPME